MASVTLSASVRQNLLSLQQTADLMAITQNRLATGKKVNSALDNPVNYFVAQGLSNRANDLTSLLDGMTNAVNTLKAADAGISAITKLVQSAQSLVTQARQTSDTTVRSNLATQFDEILDQIGNLAEDSGFNGINLLGGDDLDVILNEAGNNKITLNGVDYKDANAAPLSIADSANNWANTADLDNADTDLTAALTELRTQAKTFGSYLSTVQIRQDFTKSMINTLTVGADALTLADTNEEGANMLALQTRQQLSITALSLASQANQSVLRLFA
ncbi:MAG TPA: flagellin [Xanthobacteraceae bacterium]|nr:flagellin [Xanthobacteraceae bacterium]